MKRSSVIHAWLALAALSLSLTGCSHGCVRYNYDRPPSAQSERLVKLIDAELASGGRGAAAGAAATTANPTGWATLKGRFVLQGAAPTMQSLTTKSNDRCEAAFDQSVVVDAGSAGIQYVLIYVNEGIAKNDVDEAEPKWVNARYNLTANPNQAQPEFDQKGCVFLSHVFAFRADQSLTIKNSDSFGHNTNLATKDGALPFNQTIPGGSSVTYSPGGAERDPFPVSCAIHPWMKAYMIIRDNPYFAVTGKTGEFEIADLPAGVPLEFRVWQEKAGFVQNVKLNGAAANWSKGKFELTLNPGDVLDYNVIIDASAFN